MFLSCSLLANFSTYSMQSLDSPATLEVLKTNLVVLQNNLFPEGRPLPTEKDFVDIEAGLGVLLPNSLKEFYRAVGNRQFTRLTIATPHNGTKSNLYSLIREKHAEGMPQEWIPFCKIDEDNFFGINQQGMICRFYACYLSSSNSFQFKKDDKEAYESLCLWIINKWPNFYNDIWS